MKKTVYGFAITLVLSACTLGLEPDTDGGETYETGLLASTIEMQLGDTGGISANAAVPSKELESGLSIPSSGSASDYPEVGQNTTWEITEHDATNNIYRVEVTTTYDYTDYISEAVEVYYIEDVGTLGTYSNEDYTYDITTNARNSKYREEFYTTFAKDVRRDETITVIGDASNFPEEFTGGETFSSVVTYEQAPQQEINVNNLKLNGTRYYAEYSDKTSLIVIEENGFVVNLVHEGETIRGKSEFEGRIVIHFDADGNRESVEWSYNFNEGEVVITS